MPDDSTPAPGKYNPRLREGKTWRLTFVWEATGEPVDLTSATVKATTRKRNAAEPVIELTEDNGITVDGPAGSITVEYTATQTEDDLSGDWDLTAEFPNEDQIQILTGVAVWDRTAGR